MGLNNIGLLENTIKCYNNSNYYVYGTFGQKLTLQLVESKIKQYPKFYRTAERRENARNAVGKKKYAYDCVGLIKCYLFGGYGNVKYNSKYDLSANGMYNKCTQKGKISTIPNIKGLLVWMDGHIGVYDGSKYSYECTVSGGTFKIIKTVAKTRGWTNWGKCAFISYISDTSSKPKEETAKPSQTNNKKSIDEIAKEVIDGKWGSGEDRKKKLEKAGYNYKDVQNKVNQLLSNKKTNTNTSTNYYKACASKYSSIVLALNSIKVDSSYTHRKKIAQKNGIKNYKGTASQNTQLLNKLKNGKLIKA